MKNRDPLVSVVMLAWNRKDEVRDSLTHVFESTYSNMEVIVVDNGSSDGTAAMIEKEFPEVKLIRLPRNIGIEGFNVGFANAKGEYVVVLDDDSYPAPDAIQRMVVRFREEEIGIIAFRIEHPSTGALTTKNWPEISSRMVGCGAGIRKSTLDAVGYYDPDFFLYANDYDLPIRVWDAGQRVVYDDSIVAYHAFSPKKRTGGRNIYFGTRNGIWFDFKHLPMSLLVIGLPRHLFSMLAWAVKERSLGSYFTGVLAGFWGIRTALKKRKPVRKEIATFYLKHHVYYEPILVRILRTLRGLSYEDYHFPAEIAATPKQ